jgi:hypothetical protein
MTQWNEQGYCPECLGLHPVKFAHFDGPTGHTRSCSIAAQLEAEQPVARMETSVYSEMQQRPQ